MVTQRKKDFFVIAHNIRSLHNVGSVFRTADAFGVSKIFLTGYTGTPDNIVHEKKITKTALGAEKFVPWEYKRSAILLIKDLRLKGFKIIGLENNLRGVKIKKSVLGHPSRNPSLLRGKKGVGVVLVLGEEVKGIKKDILKLCDQLLEIPMKGKKESLNVSVAFGITAFEISKQLWI